jgi:hypothetical protein
MCHKICKAGERLPIDHRQQIHLNGTLIISNVRKKEDESSYICSANDIKGNPKRRHLTLRVIGMNYDLSINSFL